MVTMTCYIRECGGEWKKGESHHEQTIQSYIDIYVYPGETSPSGIVCAPRGDDICMVRITPLEEHMYQLQYNYGAILELYLSTC